MDLSYDGILADCRAKMQKCVAFLSDELKGLRTGRATPGLVDTVRVDAYGQVTPLTHLAQISTPDARSIVIKPFDVSQVNAIEKAILAANLGLTPNSDGKLLRLSVPMLTEETRKQLVSKAKELSEGQRIAIRNVRREANKNADAAKKDSILTEDDLKGLQDEIQGVTKECEGQIDVILKEKSGEIMEI